MQIDFQVNSTLDTTVEDLENGTVFICRPDYDSELDFLAMKVTDIDYDTTYIIDLEDSYCYQNNSGVLEVVKIVDCVLKKC